MNDDLFRNALSGINDQIRTTERIMDEAKRSIYKNNSQKEEREIRLLEASEQTARNTAVLPEILGLIDRSNEKQDEIFELLVEILAVAKSHSKDEAESKYRKVMKKAAGFTGDIETATKLMGYASTVWKFVEKIFES